MTVLDAYAVLAYLRDEEAAEEVAQLLRTGPVLATVNAAEVVDQLVRVWGRDGDDVEGDLALLSEAGLRLYPLDAELALHAGRLRAAHYHRQRCAVSMADCVAAATALRLAVPLATSDPALAAVVAATGGELWGLPDSRGERPDPADRQGGSPPSHEGPGGMGG
jgi:PIN domain nuclease of toxin-antitoxin system